MILAAIPLGALIGLSLGALGGGGSILTVPALVYVLGQSTHSSTTASLVIVGLTSLVGMVAHLRAGRVRFTSGLVFGLLGSGGSYLGSRLSSSVDPNVLLAAFSVLILIAAASMVRRLRKRPATAAVVASPAVVAVGVAAEVGSAGSRPPGTATPCSGEPGVLAPDMEIGGPEIGGPEPGGPETGRRASGSAAAPVSPLRVVVAASVVGLLTGFFGVGGGFVVVPALVLALGFDMAVAVGTSLLVIAINSASALAVRLSGHIHMDVALVVAFTAAAIGGTLAGSRVASRTHPEKLVGAFAVLLVAVSIYTATRSLPHLV
ncbi:MAG: sulfite exporter TauE/SafE family protein [Actinomycetota bacterium]|nr:sulfite exporter TauE/SafE family protein [Actinomycetota bacterium]